MEYQKITKLLLIRFITKKWIKEHNQSGESCNTNKLIRFKTSKLQI